MSAEKLAEIKEALRRATTNGIDFDITREGRRVNIGHGQLVRLSKKLDAIPDPVADAQIKKAERRAPGEDGLERLLKNKFYRLRIGGGSANLAYTVRCFISHIVSAGNTHESQVPKEAPESVVLKNSLLQSTSEDIEMSLAWRDVAPDSVAARLLDPIDLANKGIRLTLRPQNEEESLNYGTKIPQALLEILKSLKYSESENVLTKWINTTIRTQDPNKVDNMLHLVESIVNFTSFLDQSTQEELWGPETRIPGRGQEILDQPFHTLLNAVRSNRQDLTREEHANIRLKVPLNPVVSTTIRSLEEIESLVKFRYGQIYNDSHQTSLYTADSEALTPTPGDFTHLANILIRKYIDQKPPQELAKGIVKMALSAGVEDLSVMISATRFISALGVDHKVDLAVQKEFTQCLLYHARKKGLIEHPDAFNDATDELAIHPWQDAAKVNFADVIYPFTRRLIVTLLPGSLAPYHLGHDHTREILEEYDNSFAEEDERTKTQRIRVLVPAKNVAQIAGYGKSAADIGPLQARLAVTLLHLSDPNIDRKSLFITTDLQPTPDRTSDIVDCLYHTENALVAKIQRDLEQAGRATIFRDEARIAMGVDESTWRRNPDGSITLAPKDEQAQKVLEKDSIMVGRGGGWIIRMIENGSALREGSGITDMILTGGLPKEKSSSTAIKAEMARTGRVKGVTPAAEDLVKYYWSDREIARRRADYFKEFSNDNSSVEAAWDMLVNGELIPAASYRY